MESKMPEATATAPSTAPEAQAPEAEAPNTLPATPNAPDGGQQSENKAGDATPKVFSQDEVNAIVADRLKRERDKAAAEKAKADEKAAADTLKAQGEYERLYNEEKTRREAKEAEVLALQLAGIKRDLAVKYKLPPVLADRLSGSNAEEIEADAKVLAAGLPKAAAPNLNDTAASQRGNSAALSADEAQRVSGTLGIPAKYLTQ
jgi:hypothetical protein